MAVIPTRSILKNADINDQNIIEIGGSWPLTLALLRMPSGTLNRQLLGYFDVFLPTRPVLLHETVGQERRQQFRYKKGMIAFNDPKIIWSAEWVGVIEGFSIIFSEETIRRAVEDIFNERYDDLIWRPALSDYMPAIAYLGLDIASQIGSDFPAGRTFFEDQLRVFLGMLIRRFSVSSVRDTSEVGITSPQVLRAIQLISKRLKQPLNTQLISDECGASAGHLNSLFRAEIGCSLWDYVLHRRLQSIAEDLSQSDVKIEDIAKQYGLKSRTTFSKQFKAKFGLSPKAFRQKFQDSSQKCSGDINLN